jgi:membrane-bound inhibitor of C-type lysozyme
LKQIAHSGGAILRSLKMAKCIVFATGLSGFSQRAVASDLTIHLAGSAAMTHKVVAYQCDANGTKMGLPAGPFPVEYINGGGNSLAVLPVSGKSLIFANVISGSGARYAAQQYIWWEEAGRLITFSSDSLAGKMQSTCQRANAK